MLTQKHTQMFIAPLFITDKKWEQSKCLPTDDEWVNNLMWYVHAIEYSLAKKKE